MLTDGDPGVGWKFEMAIKGFDTQEIKLTEFDKDEQVRLSPKSKMFSGGHRFTFTAEGDKTRIDHDLEMNPKGIFVLMTPFMGLMAKRNLRDTAAALEEHFKE